MSFTENDRKLQTKFGKSFPDQPLHPSFTEVIAATLKTEFGGSPSAIKTVSRLTQSNERAVRNWFEGKNGPSGESLISLICRSDAVLKAVLTLAGRGDLVVVVGLADLKTKLIDTIAAIDGLQSADR